ncbi:hypothetical protein KY284_013187 [Solanum tuberosum]|nr:hypothetical protein KY284_013187 [Solanum tuberosum]
MSNMDNRTQILVNRIYDKMQTLAESIDSKSQRLFNIRDNLIGLTDQARNLQYELNQLSSEHDENMSKFLLLYEHLDTCPKRNSNPTGNITTNKEAGDVPLALSVKNISTVSTDMPISESKDEEKSRANEASSSKVEKSSSSATAEKTISGKPEKFINKVSSGTKVFSTFQVGKQNPKEEEYLKFTKDIYNLPSESGETYGVLGTTSLFPRISIFPNGSAKFAAQLFEYGYLDRIYAKPNLQEISQLPSQLVTSIKRFAEGEGVYCRFFSISMEGKDFQSYFPTINFITIEKLKSFNVKATGVDKKLPHLNKKWIQTRRALGIKALYFILKRYYDEDFQVMDHTATWMLLVKGKTKSQVLREKILEFETHRLEATEETWKMACKFLEHKHPTSEA